MKLQILSNLLLLACLSSTAIAQPQTDTVDLHALRISAETAMKRAATYFSTQVATHGGYVYHYDLDLDQRWGEGQATRDQIWVQPPGTPAVGLAYLSAYDATGDAFYLSCVQAVANALMYGQLKSGGWTNCIDFDPNGQRIALYRNGMGSGKNNSSLDDGQTQTAIRFMVQADRALGFKHAAVHEAAEIALQALLAAQFPCGAFPQVWVGPSAAHPILPANYPDYDWRSEGRIKNYWELYTFNDNLAPTTTEALLAAHAVYGDERYLNAVRRLGDFILLSQMPEPQPAWAQQYNYQMQPVWARRFEPPAISGHESQEIVALLMKIYLASGDEKYLKPIQPAIDYLKLSTLQDGSIARFYELKTNRPLYMHRSGDVYTLTYDDSNLPSHYSWKTESKAAKLQETFNGIRRQLGKQRPKPSPAGLARQAAQIIDALDAQGRWLSTAKGERLLGQTKFADGQPYLSSEEFIDNLASLAEFVAGTRQP